MVFAMLLHSKIPRREYRRGIWTQRHQNSLRWHDPDQVKGRRTHLPLSSFLGTPLSTCQFSPFFPLCQRKSHSKYPLATLRPCQASWFWFTQDWVRAWSSIRRPWGVRVYTSWNRPPSTRFRCR